MTKHFGPNLLSNLIIIAIMIKFRSLKTTEMHGQFIIHSQETEN